MLIKYLKDERGVADPEIAPLILFICLILISIANKIFNFATN
ncbi:hypothetical protein [Caldisalinibacter kiritimatiensis]|uniref:Uncharacterized protein n=1 Tax=Caldisalinibacter kiritimatiensis TaxID=1304284 RepID=R1AW99_9FIRM|nr:hypothetical protein [Caldisalinibacter kiritimatiensis]EOD01438.1 hypothetical protein L21TH_0485 [Caldisalinibacter kiritimatiensis]